MDSPIARDSHSRFEFKQILNRLKTVKLTGFTNYEADKLLYLRVLLYLESDGAKDSLATRLAPFCGDVFKYNVYNSESSQVLMYCSASYWARRDMHRIFDNVRSCADSPRCIVGSRNPHVMPSHLLNCLYVSRWRQELIAAGIDQALAGYLVSYLAKAKNFLQFIKCNKKIFDNTRLFITLFDQDYDEYLITEYCKQRGIKTCVLQHGHFAGMNEEEDLLSMPFPYENLNADYFLAWGDYSKRRAISCGIESNRIIVAGNPKYIDTDYTTMFPITQNQAKRQFILMLDADLYMEQRKSNAEMLHLAELECERLNLTCGVRYHPGHHDSALEKAVDMNQRLTTLSTETPLSDYFGKYDFFICGESSVYAELLLFGQIVFRFVQPDRYDKYAEIKVGVFSDYNSLNSAILRLQNNPEDFRSELAAEADRLCWKGNVRERYRMLISKLAFSNDLMFKQ